jgi:hypothetical protein
LEIVTDRTCTWTEKLQDDAGDQSSVKSGEKPELRSDKETIGRSGASDDHENLQDPISP